MIYAPSREPVEQARLARTRNWRLRLGRIEEEFPAEQNPGFAAERGAADLCRTSAMARSTPGWRSCTAMRFGTMINGYTFGTGGWHPTEAWKDCR